MGAGWPLPLGEGLSGTLEWLDLLILPPDIVQASKKPAAPIYGGWFRVLFGGSKWNRARPGGNADMSFP